MNDESVVRLFSDGLLSKWGFSDGDEPEGLLDYYDEHGIDWTHLEWHPVLIKLVRRYLLPVLDQKVEVVEIQTAHNPIRAQMVDGVGVEDRWYEVDSRITLTPEMVEVPMSTVLQMALEGTRKPCR